MIILLVRHGQSGNTVELEQATRAGTAAVDRWQRDHDSPLSSQGLKEVTTLRRGFTRGYLESVLGAVGSLKVVCSPERCAVQTAAEAAVGLRCSRVAVCGGLELHADRIDPELVQWRSTLVLQQSAPAQALDPTLVHDGSFFDDIPLDGPEAEPTDFAGGVAVRRLAGALRRLQPGGTDAAGAEVYVVVTNQAVIAQLLDDSMGWGATEAELYLMNTSTTCLEIRPSVAPPVLHWVNRVDHVFLSQL